MKKAIFNFSAVMILSIAAGYFTEAGAQTVSGSVNPVAKGGSARGTVVMNIPGGLHVNSNRPASEYAIPTSVSLSAQGARVSRVTYPRGKNRKFQFSENPINVYENRVSFPFTVTVPRNFRGDTVKVRAVVRYQACTDEVCYPPRSKEVTLTAKVR